MRYKISYWKHKNDEIVDIETIIDANSFDDAFKNFRIDNPFVKIREIKEYFKTSLV